LRPARRRPRRVGVAEAKAKLSEVLRSLHEGPVVIHSRGRDLGALIDIDAFERVIDGGDADEAPRGGAAFLARVEDLKRRYHGGVDDFEPVRAEIVTKDPFRAQRRR
jgi:prevent-host-death family protein